MSKYNKKDPTVGQPGMEDGVNVDSTKMLTGEGKETPAQNETHNTDQWKTGAAKPHGTLGAY